MMFGFINRRWLWVVVGIALLAAAAVAAWQARFSPAQPAHFLYLDWDEAENLQLFLTDVNGEGITRLTTTGHVVEFSVAPGGRRIAYVAQQADNSTEIWLVTLNGRLQPSSPTLLLACPQAGCRAPVWHPDGRRLIYERREILPGDGRFGPPALWWLDTVSQETITVLADAAAPAMAAAISPDGQWLSYASPQDEGIHVYNLETGRRFFINSQVGAAASWNPSSENMIVSDVQLLTFHGDEGDDHLQHSHDYALSSSLFLADVYSQARRPLTTDPSVDDGTPAWSPDGQWVLFGRKPARTNTGRQLVLVRPDGSGLRTLTDDLTIHHGVPSWSADGRYILFQRVNVFDLSARPEIWLLSLEDGQMRRLTTGIQPAWLAAAPAR